MIWLIYSHSRIKKYEDCPYRFYLTYIKGLKEKTTEPLELGKATHKAIEEIIKGANKKDALDQGMKESSLALDRAELEKLVNNAKSERFRHAESIEVEHHFKVELERGLFLQGYIDVLQFPFGSYSFIDWKTNRIKYDPMDTHQLGLYAYGIYKEFDVQQVTGTLHFLRYYKRPIETKVFTKKEMMEARDWALRLVYEIENKRYLLNQGKEYTELFQAEPSSQCQHCPFAVQCHYLFSKIEKGAVNL